jgi:hypothetical protein
VATYLTPDRRSTLIARLAQESVFSSLQEKCINLNRSQASEGRVAERSDAAAELYAALRRLSRDRPREPQQWREVARGLTVAYREFPSPTAARALEAALKASRDRVGLLRFRLYRYLDESDPNPFRELAMLARWLFTPGRKPLRAEYDDARRLLMEDIVRQSPPAAGMPVFVSDRLRDSHGEEVLLSFTDPASMLFGRRAVFVFFKTTCSYCDREIRVLSRYLRLSRTTTGPALEAVGIQLLTGLPGGLERLEPFEKSLKPAFPLLVAAKDGIAGAYGVRSVPLMLFLDEAGAPYRALSFRVQTNLTRKVGWFLDEFAGAAAVPLAPARDRAIAGADRSAAPGGPVSGAATRGDTARGLLRVDLYYDPGCRACDELLDRGVPAIAEAAGVTVVLTRHDVTDRRTLDQLSELLSQRGIALTSLPLAVVGDAVLQGIPAIEQGLTSSAASPSDRR